MLDEKALVQIILDAGADNAAPISVGDMTFDRVFRDICASNSCGNYGMCYMCPPDVGDIDVLMDEAKGYDRGVLYQTITAIEDSFDFEGMSEAGVRHNACTQRIARVVGRRDGVLHLSSGGCRVCKTCAKRTGDPCRHPNLAMASLEAYGVDVYRTATAAGLKYINGPNTVTFFGMVLYQEH